MRANGPGRVDVIMPAHDAAATVARSVESALACPECARVLVIDDASRDGTAAIVESLAGRAPGRVVLVRLAVNGGPAYARNVGLALAESDLVAFLDADDLYESQALTVAVAALDGLADLALVRLALKPLGLDPALASHPGFGDAWTRVAFTVPSNVVVRRAVVAAAGGFPEDDLFRRHGGEDVALFQAVVRTCRVGTLFTEPGVLYRIRPDCAALKLIRACLFDILPPGIEADLPKAESVTVKIMQRLKLLSPFVRAKPGATEVRVTWSG